MDLIIVESPSKAKTISKYLKGKYKVDASGGHVRDLPEKTLGVKITDNFEPKYEITASKKEIIKTASDKELNKLSKYYLERYSNDLHIFKDIYNCNLIDGFKHFQDVGLLEIITCGATHGYFPILYVNEKTVKAQIAVRCANI